MPTISSKQHDTAPTITAQALDSAGNPISLAAVGTTVRFIAKNVVNGTVLVAAAAVISDAVNGKMSYTPQAADVTLPGTFRCEFEVTFGGGGGIETFPQRRGNDEILWIIAPDLG